MYWYYFQKMEIYDWMNGSYDVLSKWLYEDIGVLEFKKEGRV